MSYRQNWLQHTLATLSGRGFSRDLASDFWPREALWSADAPVSLRWAKLAYVYTASAVAQIVLPLVLVALIIDLTKGLPFEWWLIMFGVGAGLGLATAIALSTFVYVSIARQMQHSRPTTDEQAGERADRGLTMNFWLAFVIFPAIVVALLMLFGG